MDLSIRVIAFNTFVQLASLASRHPHLSVVQIVKDHFHRAVSLNPSAAEKRDYEELQLNRQAKFESFFLLKPPKPSPPLLPHFARKTQRCKEPRII